MYRSTESLVHARSEFSTIMQITSTRNPFLKDVRRAAAEGCPTQDGLIVAEGPHLLEEALRSEWRLEKVLTTPEARRRHADLLSRADAELVEISDHAFESASATETGQGVLTLLRPRQWSWDDLIAGRTMLIALDRIQDPGNAGTMVRSAEAFGATGIVLTTGSVRVSNGKFLRAAAGSLFRMPFQERVSVRELTAIASEQRLTLYALTGRADRDFTGADLTIPCAFCVGSEGVGLSDELLASAVRLRIPVSRVESLNAAVACSIALYEANRQRSAPTNR